LASATNSPTDSTGSVDGTMKKFAARQICPMGAKSFTGSQRRSLASAGLAVKNVVTSSHV
jgi:hypothetical protein